MTTFLLLQAIGWRGLETSMRSVFHTWHFVLSFRMMLSELALGELELLRLLRSVYVLFFSFHHAVGVGR